MALYQMILQLPHRPRFRCEFDLQLFANVLQNLLSGKTGVGDIRQFNVFRQVFGQRAQQHGFAAADFAGDHHNPLAGLYGVFQSV